MKRILLFTVVLLFGFSVKAQDIDVGLKAGVNFAQLSGNTTNGLDGRTGFHAGGLIIFELIDYLGVQGEVVYSQQGYTEVIEGMEATGKLDYINIPVLVNFEAADGLSIQGGPQVGFNVSNTVELTNGDDTEIDLRSADISAVAGLQYIAPLGLMVQARYNFGLTDIISDVDAHNSVFSLSVGWIFD